MIIIYNSFFYHVNYIQMDRNQIYSNVAQSCRSSTPIELEREREREREGGKYFGYENISLKIEIISSYLIYIHPLTFTKNDTHF